jgi:hypothetical protein
MREAEKAATRGRTSAAHRQWATGFGTRRAGMTRIAEGAAASCVQGRKAAAELSAPSRSPPRVHQKEFTTCSGSFSTLN